MQNNISINVVYKSLTILLSAFVWLLGSNSATASDFVFDMTNIGATNIDVQVTASQWDSKTIRFTIDQDNPNAFGDLRGLLFHVNENVVDLNDLDISFVSAIQNITDNAEIFNITPTFSLNNATMDGLSNYDVLVELGQNGIGQGDDIKSITFDLATTVIGGSLNLDTFFPADMEHFMAVRASSSFDGNDREGSSKLSGGCCDTPSTDVPEPALGGLFALALGGLLWRRRWAD